MCIIWMDGCRDVCMHMYYISVYISNPCKMFVYYICLYNINMYIYIYI